MAYAISDVNGPNGEHFVRVGDIETSVQYHFAFNSKMGLRFTGSQAWVGDPPRLGLPTEAPDHVLDQVSQYARQQGWT